MERSKAEDVRADIQSDDVECWLVKQYDKADTFEYNKEEYLHIEWIVFIGSKNYFMREHSVVSKTKIWKRKVGTTVKTKEFMYENFASRRSEYTRIFSTEINFGEYFTKHFDEFL